MSERLMRMSRVPILTAGMRPDYISRYKVLRSTPNMATASFTERYSRMSGTCRAMVSNRAFLSFASFLRFHATLLHLGEQ